MRLYLSWLCTNDSAACNIVILASCIVLYFSLCLLIFSCAIFILLVINVWINPEKGKGKIFVSSVNKFCSHLNIMQVGDLSPLSTTKPHKIGCWLLNY